VVVHFRTVTGFGLAVAEVESLADLDGGKIRGIVSDRRCYGPARTLRRLEADDVKQRSLTAGHLAVGKTAIGTPEILEAGDALHHLVARQIKPRELFHRFLQALALSAIFSENRFPPRIKCGAGFFEIWL
jgi:hypothetical protein